MIFIFVYFPILHTYLFKGIRKGVQFTLVATKVWKIQRWNDATIRIISANNGLLSSIQIAIACTLNTSRHRRNYAGASSTSLHIVAHTFSPSYRRSKIHATYNFLTFVVAQRREPFETFRVTFVSMAFIWKTPSYIIIENIDIWSIL